MLSPLTSSNRIVIPAICRIRNPRSNATAGTAVLVGPGVLLTSNVVIGSKANAASLTAIFFEGTKKKPVDVKLLPEKFLFQASYPEYMDYCLVACQEEPIFNVTPVHVPLVHKEWTPVREGDTVLVVQHPITAPGGLPVPLSDENDATEIRRFEEILRCRNDLYFLKTNGLLTSSGCPVFNDIGQLIGLQSQLRADGEGVVSRVLTITSIVKHLFANMQLSKLPQNVQFNDVWDTWFVEKDTSRVCFIMGNFQQREMVRLVTLRLCEMTADPQYVRSVTECGAIAIILSNVIMFADDENLACSGLRALWNVSIGEEKILDDIVQNNGVQTLLAAMEAFPANEEIMQFGAVLLHNIATAQCSPSFTGELGQRSLRVVLASVKRYTEVMVLQKFSLGFITSLVRANPPFSITIVKEGLMDHLGGLMDRMRSQVFLMEVLMTLMGELVQQREAVEASVSVPSMNVPMSHIIEMIIEIMLQYTGNETILLQGNRSLWGFGNDTKCRATILQNPKSHDALCASIPSLVASAR